MRIEGVLWLRDVIDKLIEKHGVETSEVEQTLDNNPKTRFVEKGERESEDVYLAFGQTDEGRYLAILFIYKRTSIDRERARYGTKRTEAIWQKINLNRFPNPNRSVSWSSSSTGTTWATI